MAHNYSSITRLARARFQRAAAVAAVATLTAVPASAQTHGMVMVMPGALPHGIPDLCASPNITSVQSGAWSSPGTWSAGRVPAQGDMVSIAAGTSVKYDVVSTVDLNC